MNKNKVKKGLIPYLFLFLILSTVVFLFSIMNQKVHTLSYDEFVGYAEGEAIAELNIIPRSSAGVYEITGKLENYNKNESFSLTVPLSDEIIGRVLDVVEKQGVVINTSSDPESSWLMLFVIRLLPSLLLVGFAFYFLTKQMGGTANKSMDFGRSKARLNEESNKTTFKQVAGLDEEKEELAELIDFLKDFKKWELVFLKEFY